MCRLLYYTTSCSNGQEMEDIINTEPGILRNYKLLRDITGIGLVNSVFFIVYTFNFQSFKNARKYVCYGGAAPFKNSSGTSYQGKSRVCHLANKRIKTNLSNAACSAVQHDPELCLYYDRKLKEGKELRVIMNTVKFKLITRVFAVIKRQSLFVRLHQAG